MISLKRRTNCLLVVMSVFFLFLTSYQANALSFNVYETDVMEFDDLFESFSDHDIQGDYAYVVSHNELFIFDISDPTNLSEVSSLEVNATIRDAAINGDYVYIGYSEGLQIVDVSDRANPELVEVLDDGVAFFALDAHDNILCLTSIGFHIYDISDPTVPVELSSIENVASVEAKISGDYIYCAARGIQGSGLRIIDISDPENAFETANVLGFPSAVAIDVHDDIAAIVGGQDFGEVFRLFDVSDPSNPIERCLFETPPGIIPGGFTDVLLQDNIMVAMHNDTYMRVFDISNPENPIESGRIDVTQFVQYLDFASESVVAMAEWDQYRTLDVSFAQNAYYLNAEDTGFYQILEIENITRDGQPMDIGTSVAVFDGNFLVGTNTHMTDFPFTIYAYGENDWVALPGFVDGNPMYFRIWSPSEAAEFIAEPTFSEGEGIFQWREQNTLTLEALDGPVLNFDDSPYNFGEVDANTTAEYELLLTNTGIPDLELTDILSSDPRFVPEFTEMTIPGGSSETLTIYFTPEGETLYASELTFSSNVPLFADFSVDLFGTGVGGGGVIITVPLQANYFELVSTHVQPLNLDAANVFDLEDLVIVYDHVGGILFPPDINTIGDIVVTRGYQIFVTSPQIWDLIGVQIDPLTEYTIHRSTWNWIGYPFNFPMPVTEGMADIEDQVSIVISDDGRLWVPHLGINTMGDLLPGEGYMVFSQDDDVTFQYGQNQLLANNPGNDYTPIIEAPDAPPATGKPYAVLVNMTDHLRELNPAIIEVYDGGLLVGKSLVSDDEYTPVIAWEGSPEHDLAGFKKGNPISVQVLDATGNLLSTCEPAVFQNRSGHHFGEGPYANMQLELIQSDQSDLPSEFTVGGAYPNPFNATLTVPFSLPVRGNVTLSLFNTLGQEIFTNSKSYNAGEHRFTFEGNEYGSGVFFLRVSSGTMTLTQKVMLLR